MVGPPRWEFYLPVSAALFTAQRSRYHGEDLAPTPPAQLGVGPCGSHATAKLVFEQLLSLFEEFFGFAPKRIILRVALLRIRRRFPRLAPRLLLGRRLVAGRRRLVTRRRLIARLVARRWLVTSWLIVPRRLIAR